MLVLGEHSADPKPLASVSTMKGLLKSDKARTGVEVRACFNSTNVTSETGVQRKLPDFSISVSGLAMEPKWRTKQW